MKTFSFSLQQNPQADGIVPLAWWELDELFDLVDAGEEPRSIFRTEKIMLHAGGWQSWSPGWELAPGEQFPAHVRLIPRLRKLSAAPWDCKDNGSAPQKKGEHRGEVSASFIIYLRAGPWYLALASELMPLCFFISEDHRIIRAGVYINGDTDPYKDKTIAKLHIFLSNGYFAFKDTIKTIYAQENSFASLAFLGAGKPGIDFRPGGYASWYNHYTKINENIIISDLEGLIKTDNLINLRYIKREQPAIFQIDDGWEQAVGDWEIDTAKFPRGLKPLAQEIEQAGLIPGLWLAPFLITRSARIFREKPQWLLKTDGRLVQAGWNPHWDGAYYCLDLSRSDVLEYLSSLIQQVIEEWGFRYIKLDFLYAGFLHGDYSGAANPKSCIPAEIYERAINILTKQTQNAAGDPVAYLGCGLPFGASYRQFPLSRIGTDTKESWDWRMAKLLNHTGRPSAVLSLRDTIGRSFMNGTIYINDPDVIFLRSENCTLTETEKECIALVNYLFASQIMCSDDFLALSKTDLDFTRRINKLYDELDGEEYGATEIRRDIYLIESRSGKISGLINLSDKPYILKIDMYNTESAIFSEGTWLVDHRLNGSNKNQLCFARRSISICRM